MREIDWGVFEWINRWPQSWEPFLKFFSVALSNPVVKVGFGIMLVAMIARNPKTRKAVILALLSIGLANTMTNVFKEAHQGSRPFQEAPYSQDGGKTYVNPVRIAGVPHRVILRVGHSDSKGTASAHSANMAALAFAMCYFLRRWGIPWIGVALLTGISRIYTGAHFPYQVLLGWGCGVFAALVVIKTWEAFVSRRSSVQSGEGNEEPEPA